MSDNSAIEWTTHTFNPWWGCARVSPGCVRCYADAHAQRYGHQVWRRHGPRRMLSDQNWARPLKWNRDAKRTGEPAKVFCASMADVFEDHPDVREARKRLWGVIESTPWLTWQLLTKRPENVAGMVPWGDSWPENVWIGASAETQRWADERLPYLLRLPATVRFVSAEPLLGPIDLESWLPVPRGSFCETHWSWLCGNDINGGACRRERLSWLIIGGESGHGARPMNLAWAHSLIRQCRNAQVPAFMKQVGSVSAKELGPFAGLKGGNWEALPDSLRVREFPRATQGAAA